jgi:hypothetical protein
MTTYILILVLTSTVQIPGFATMEDCQAAGNAAQAAVQGTWVPYLKKERLWRQYVCKLQELESRGVGKPMLVHLEKLRTQVAECEMIRDLATDQGKRRVVRETCRPLPRAGRRNRARDLRLNARTSRHCTSRKDARCSVGKGSLGGFGRGG